MKKNRMMRLASVLLVLTLLSTSVISGTFAKYVTTGSVSDTARVAKFGVVISTSGTLYSDAYVANEAADNKDLPAEVYATAYSSGDGVSVAAATRGNNVVAPGTKSYGSGLTFGISGTPEVATRITGTIKARDIYLKKGTYGVMVKATVTRDNFATLKDADTLYTETSGSYTKVEASNDYSGSANYFILTDKCTIGSDYYPVKYTLTGETSADGKTEDIANALTTVMNGTLVAGVPDTPGLTTYTIPDTAKVFDANTNLGGTGMLGNEVLTWEWEFGDPTNNARDTILGDMMARLGTVVYEDTGTYKNVVYDDANKLVKQSGGTTVIASLQTSFDITLTVSQVD